jgi:hypothetical protein
MEWVIPCPNPKCGKVLAPNAEQLAFIQRMHAKGADLMVLQCVACYVNVMYNPQHPRGERKPVATKEPVLFQCPVSGCTHLVGFIEARKGLHGSFWGCGECGTQWGTKKELDAAILASIARYPYRKQCYRKGKSGWEPAEPEDPEIEELIRKEPIDGA